MKIEFQRIRLMQAKVGRCLKPALQHSCQIPVNFHGVQWQASLQKSVGHGAFARSNLYQMISPTRIYGRDNAMHYGIITEKVLAKAFARNVVHQGVE